LAGGKRAREVRSILLHLGIATVCQEANCPNMSECFDAGTATFLLMGKTCTRNCSFCDIKTGVPAPLDSDEPARIAEAVRRLGLSYVVLTVVTRDDLLDCGAAHMSDTIRIIRAENHDTKIEILTSDLGGSRDALRVLTGSHPDVINHNVETVPRLYPGLRPQADYRRSLCLLRDAKEMDPSTITKSGIIVGVGEEIGEVQSVLNDLRECDVDVVTIGQYLAPSSDHAPVVRYVHPDEFEQLAEYGRSVGFKHVESGPLVRSSYRAAQQVADG
jgi:lipoic acid synthetase